MHHNWPEDWLLEEVEDDDDDVLDEEELVELLELLVLEQLDDEEELDDELRLEELLEWLEELVEEELIDELLELGSSSRSAIGGVFVTLRLDFLVFPFLVVMAFPRVKAFHL